MQSHITCIWKCRFGASHAHAASNNVCGLTSRNPSRSTHPPPVPSRYSSAARVGSCFSCSYLRATASRSLLLPVPPRPANRVDKRPISGLKKHSLRALRLPASSPQTHIRSPNAGPYEPPLTHVMFLFSFEPGETISSSPLGPARSAPGLTRDGLLARAGKLNGRRCSLDADTVLCAQPPAHPCTGLFLTARRVRTAMIPDTAQKHGSAVDVTDDASSLQRHAGTRGHTRAGTGRSGRGVGPRGRLCYVPI